MKSATFKKYKLSAYAATAAILVSNDALAQVVYQDIDPDLEVGGDLFSIDIADAYLDLNMDGSDDFRIGIFYDYGLSGYFPSWSVFIEPLGENQVAFELAMTTVYSYGGVSEYITFEQQIAIPIDLGEIISDEYDFTSLKVVFDERVEGYDEFDSYFFGDWPEGGVKFCAFSLMQDDGMHYGWIRMKWELDIWGEGFITAFDYAYNATPDAPIIAGYMPVECTPATFNSIISTPTAVKLFFDEVDDAVQYKLIYREAGTTDPWTIKVKSTPAIKLTGLDCDTEYEYRVQSRCDNGVTLETSLPGVLSYFTTDACKYSSGEYSLMAFPNPANRYFNLQTDTKEGEMLITNMLGEVVLAEKLTDGQMLVDVSSWANGLYHIQVLTPEGDLARTSIVVN